MTTTTHQYRSWCEPCLWQGPERLVSREATQDGKRHDNRVHGKPITCACPRDGVDPYCLVHNEPYCARCDYDDHTCPGCGEPLRHGVGACAECKRENA